MTIELCQTPLLDVVYQVGGAANGLPVLLLHGWPDDATTFDRIAPVLHAEGFRTFAPWQRGCGPTRFRSNETMRSGETAALAQDALDFADALGLHEFGVVGHGAGAHVAYLLASVFPERVTHCAAISTPWEPRPGTPPLSQARAQWHEWFLMTEPGAAYLRTQGEAFARFLWETGSPPGWFDEGDFETVAASFENPDWAEVALHGFRVRWGAAQPVPRYAELAKRAHAAQTIAAPTLVIQGGDDCCSLPAATEGRPRGFTGAYERRLLGGIGHFPTREAPEHVAEVLARFLSPSALLKKAS